MMPWSVDAAQNFALVCIMVAVIALTFRKGN